MGLAYLIAESDVTDAELMQSYAEKARETFEEYGGKFVAGGNEVAHMDGLWKPPRVVIISFPSMESAKAWYSSPEYQELLPMRYRAANSSLIFIN